MKPAPFAYHDPASIAEALEVLAQVGDEGKLLAGGQSLVPLMNFRLARPSALVDLNRIRELGYLHAENGALRIGAMTRQREVERSHAVAQGWPILREATRYIGHEQTRNRGTVGGSLAHADPAAELPGVMAVLDAEVVIRGGQGERVVPADGFVTDYYTTVVEPTELLVEVRVPALPPRTGWAFQEVSPIHGGFAVVGVATLLTLDPAGRIERARLAVIGAAPAPVRARGAEASLVGQSPAEALFREAAALASQDLDPSDDVHATAAYRRQVGGVLARRALEQAVRRAQEVPS